MRSILTLVTLMVFSFKVTAMVKPPEGDNRHGHTEVRIVNGPLVPTTLDISIPAAKTGTTILYKMKDNIIRRELSFTLGKKWMKWA